MRVWGLQRTEDGIEFPGTGAADRCGCWELNPRLLQKHQLLLINEPSLQCPNCMVFFGGFGLVFAAEHILTGYDSLQKQDLK